jgi:hypothetical protein
VQNSKHLTSREQVGFPHFSLTSIDVEESKEILSFLTSIHAQQPSVGTVGQHLLARKPGILSHITIMRGRAPTHAARNYSLVVALVAFVELQDATHAFAPLAPPCRILRGTSSSSTTSLSMFDFLKPKEEEKSNKKNAESEEPPPDFSDDPVDKIFGFFFGQKEESPMGMKRFGRGAFVRCGEMVSIQKYARTQFIHTFFLNRAISGTVSCRSG